MFHFLVKVCLSMQIHLPELCVCALDKLYPCYRCRSEAWRKLQS